MVAVGEVVVLGRARSEEEIARLRSRHDLVHYRPFGAARELWNPYIRASEVLLDGPAGTGKTRGSLEELVDDCRTHRGVRCGLFRKTRESMNETILNTLETFVLGPVFDTALTPLTRPHRKKYVFPETGSEIILAGFDDIQKLFSLELTRAHIEEAIEVTQTEATSLWRGLRYRPQGYVKPHRLTYCTNPGPEDHWLNWRCSDLDPENGRALRLLSKHEDNPNCTPEFLRNLEANMSGEMLERMRWGRWVAATGRIVGTFGAHNILTGDLVGEPGALPDLRIAREGDVDWLVLSPRAPVGVIRDETGQRWVRVAWWGASIDWGAEKPGTIQLWAVDEVDRHYLVAERYETRMPGERYAETIAAWYDRFRLRAVVYDHAQPEQARAIVAHMLRLGFGGMATQLMQKSPKEFGPSVDVIRWRFAHDRRGVPRAFVLDNSLLAPDPELLAERKATSLAPELRALKWAVSKELGIMREVPDPTCADHAFDAARYWFLWCWYQRHGHGTTKPAPPPGTLGDVLGHRKVKARRKQ